MRNHICGCGAPRASWEPMEPRLLLSSQALVDTGDLARLLVPTSDSLGGAWRATEFGDSAWAVGPTGIGYEQSSGYEPYIATDIGSMMYGANPSIYIRMPFEVTDPYAVSAMTLRMMYDDGFAAWLNGEPIASNNAPSPLQWNSTAPNYHGDSTPMVYESFDVSAHVDHLRAGPNLLAIQGLNEGITSSDFLVVPELIAEVDDAVFHVIDSDPAGGAFLAQAPSHLDLRFSEAVLSTSLEASDLSVNGVSATGFSVLAADEVRFDLPAGMGAGVYDVTMAAASVTAASGKALGAYAGQFTVAALPQVQVLPAENVTGSSAEAPGVLADTGWEDPVVGIAWGDEDGGTEIDAWDEVLVLPPAGVGLFHADLAGLAAETMYFYRALATNAAGTAWADHTESFVTGPAETPSIAVLQATDIGRRSAWLHGEVTDAGGEDPAVTVVWGDEDGGASLSAWDHQAEIGTRGLGEFATAAADLQPGTTYYFSALAVNSAGASWAPAAGQFQTVALDEWYVDALDFDASPVDLSFLNDDVAGEHGFLQADGDRLVFEDGTEVRFWGGNIAAYSIFETPERIELHARRIAQLGYNLMRIHHHDSAWVPRTVIDKTLDDTRHLDAEVMDRLDYWIKCLKDNGVYVWLDLEVGRRFKAGDGITIGWDDIAAREGNGNGFRYFNTDIQALMQEFNENYLGHVNTYTGLAYKDDPGIVAVMITNEDDMTNHYGHLLTNTDYPTHYGIFSQAAQDFSADTGLAYSDLMRWYSPGPSKYLLNEYEHRFNERMISHLRGMGLRVPIATTQYWQEGGVFQMPALMDGDLIDVHSYGSDGELETNPRITRNAIGKVAAAQVYETPLSVSEWDIRYPNADRHTAAMYMAAISALQGWDALMVFTYAGRGLYEPTEAGTHETWADPARTAAMPAGALAYRQGHVSDAANHYLLQLSPQQVYEQDITAQTSATIRTLAEQSKISIGLADSPYLDWDSQATPGADVIVINDPNQDYIPPGQTWVESDTAELRRDWAQGVMTIDTARTQAALGKIGGKVLQTDDVRFEVDNAEATVVVSSLDGRAIDSSREMLLTLISDVQPTTGDTLPYLSRPVLGTLTLSSAVPGMRLVPLAGDGTELAPISVTQTSGEYSLELPPDQGTHWFILRAGDLNADGVTDAADIDAMAAEVASGGNDPAYDLTGDGAVDASDLTAIIEQIFQTHHGDAGLDGAVTDADYTIWADHYGQSAGWASGDFNGDGRVTDADYTVWADHYGAGAAGDAATVESQVGSVVAETTRAPATDSSRAAVGTVDLLTRAGEYTLRDDQVGTESAPDLEDILQVR